MTSLDRRLAPRGGPWPDRALERDACGIGFVADVTGRTDRRVVDLGLEGLARLRHRGAFASDEQTGDGAGVLLPLPRRWLAGAIGTGVSEASNLGLLMLFISDRRRGVRSKTRAATNGSRSCDGGTSLSTRRRSASMLGRHGRASCRPSSARRPRTNPRGRSNAPTAHGAGSMRSPARPTATCMWSRAASPP